MGWLRILLDWRPAAAPTTVPLPKHHDDYGIGSLYRSKSSSIAVAQPQL